MFNVFLFVLSSLLLFCNTIYVFQFEDYSVCKFIRWIYSRKLFCLLNLTFQIILYILNCLFLIKNGLVFFALLINVILFGFYLCKCLKVRNSIKFTKRVIRSIIIFSILLVVTFLLLDNFLIYVFYLPLMSLIIALTICVSGAVEYVVFLRFRDEAVKKLKSCKDLIIIGITGSYGKTSVKNILYSILSKKYSVCMTPKSFNTPNGIVKTIREKLNYNNEIFICELGADKPNDIKKLTKILGENLKFGIITAVGKQHISGFKTIDKVYATKYQLAEAVYNNNGVMFFNTDNEYVLKMFKQYYGKKYSVSMDNLKSSLTYCSGYYLREDGSDFSAKINNRDLSFSTNLLGKHNILNALIAISVAKLFCVDYNDMNDAISELKPIPNRLELKTLANGARLIDNGFNSNPFSARKSLEVLSVYKNYKIVITPGFVELGNIQFDENFKYGAELSKIADEVWIVNNVNKNALKQGLLDNGFNLHNIKYFRKFNSEIVNSMQLYDKNTIFLIENDLPSSYK